MKKLSILTWFLVVLFLMPMMVNAATYYELPPKVVIEGINETEYDINKIITEQEVTVELHKKDSDIFYSWSFDKDKIGDTLSLDFELNFNSPKEEEIASLAPNNDKMFLSFDHHGDLPSKARIRVSVAGTYTDGEKLYLYYYNEEKKQLEYIDRNLEVKDGYVEFEIDHCSEYLLTTTIVNDAVNNPKNMNYIIVVMVLIICVLVGATMFSTKK